MKLTKYPQSCILIEGYKGKNILIDPGKYVYEQTDVKPEDFKDIDILLLTHEHSDHTMPEAIKVIVENNSPIILTNKPTYDILKEQGIDSEITGEKTIDEIKIRAIETKHGPLPSGDPAPENIAFLIDDKFLHLGDTSEIEEKPYAEVIFVPVGGGVTFDGKKAAEFIKEIKPKLAIPIHYSNPKFPGRPEDLVEAMSDSDIQIQVLEEKESIEVEE